MPVEKMMGFFVERMYSRSQGSLTSPEEIFHMVMPILSSIFAASTEKGVLRKIRPRFSACSLRPIHCSSVNCILSQ